MTKYKGDTMDFLHKEFFNPVLPPFICSEPVNKEKGWKGWTKCISYYIMWKVHCLLDQQTKVNEVIKK